MTTAAEAAPSAPKALKVCLGIQFAIAFMNLSFAGATWRLPVALAVLRGIALFPVPFYWRRMTWR
jgi:hypothetical protein